MIRYRAELKGLYSEYSPHRKRKASLENPNRNAAKQVVVGRLRSEYARLRESWNGCRDYDNWFQQPINNAKLNTIDSYYRLVPAFRQLLQDSGQDLVSFYSNIKTLSKGSKASRLTRLEELGLPSPR